MARRLHDVVAVNPVTNHEVTIAPIAALVMIFLILLPDAESLEDLMTSWSVEGREGRIFSQN